MQGFPLVVKKLHQNIISSVTYYSELHMPYSVTIGFIILSSEDVSVL